jgi:hypothetical protein
MPPELFIATHPFCAGIYSARFAQRNGLYPGIEGEARAEAVNSPARLKNFR